MDGPRDYHTKQSKSEKDKYHIIITYMWSLKYDTNLSMKQIHRHREQTCGCQGGGKGGREELAV